MKSLLALFLLFAVSTGSAQSSPKVAAVFQTKIRIEKTWVKWKGPLASIEREILCETELSLKLYDVRNQPHLRGRVEEVQFPCRDQVDGTPVMVSVGGKAEWLRPRDFSGWVEGERDLLRVALSLFVQAPVSGPALQDVSSFEFLSEDLQLGSLVFRLAPDDLIGLTCSQEVCRNEGLPAIFRAYVEMKKSLPIN